MSAISGKTRIAAVLGWPVEHSRSPAMLNAAFLADQVDAVLVPVAVPPESLATVVSALRAINAVGASVTIPHKLAAAALCDELSLQAQEIGAVNCLQFADNRVIGHNTDCEGFRDGLSAAGFDVLGKNIVLLGAGGAARAIAYGVRGAQTIELVARNPERVTWSFTPPATSKAVARAPSRARAWTDENLRDCFSRADLVVDCTSTGLDEATDLPFAQSLPLDALPAGAWVATLVYHRRTALLERASAAGYSTLDGKAMLVHQGARAFTLWTGMPAPVEVMARALDASLAR